RHIMHQQSYRLTPTAVSSTFFSFNDPATTEIYTLSLTTLFRSVALAMTLPNTNLPQIGGMDGGKFLVIFAGGLIGLIIMRFAANLFVKLLHSRPGLEIAAFAIVGWVCVNLSVLNLGHSYI